MSKTQEKSAHTQLLDLERQIAGEKARQERFLAELEAKKQSLQTEIEKETQERRIAEIKAGSSEKLENAKRLAARLNEVASSYRKLHEEFIASLGGLNSKHIAWLIQRFDADSLPLFWEEPNGGRLVIGGHKLRHAGEKTGLERFLEEDSGDE